MCAIAPIGAMTPMITVYKQMLPVGTYGCQMFDCHDVSTKRNMTRLTLNQVGSLNLIILVGPPGSNQPVKYPFAFALQDQLSNPYSSAGDRYSVVSFNDVAKVQLRGKSMHGRDLYALRKVCRWGTPFFARTMQTAGYRAAVR